MQNQRAPKQIAVYLAIGFCILSASGSLWGLNSPLFRLDANQVLYLFSTSAQVLAGIYGLTLTGFVFLRNEMSREEADDATLKETNDSLRSRYFQLLLVVTASVLVSLLLSNLAISGASQVSSTAESLLLNMGQAAYATSILAVVYFFLDAVAPNRVARASAVLQHRVDPTASAQNHGDISEFLRNYNQLEHLLDRAEPVSISSYASDMRSGRRRMPNSRLAQILFRNEKISEELFGRLIRLITLRNSIIHSGDPVVSPDAVTESRNVLTDLKHALESSASEY